MMGKSHLMLGASGWLAAGAPALDALGQPLGVPELAAGTVVAAGAAMLPDLDHPQATVSRSLGPVTEAISRGFSTALGGHRNGSHSLLFAGVIGAGLGIGLGSSSGPWLALLICFFFSSLVIRTLTEADGLICAAVSGLLGATLVSVAPQMDWIFFAVIIGCLLHDLGDILTPEGVPPLWPLSKARLKVPVIGHTGDWREKGIAALCGLAACWLLAVNVYAPIWDRNRSAERIEARTSVPAKTVKPADDKAESIPAELKRKLIY